MQEVTTALIDWLNSRSYSERVLWRAVLESGSINYDDLQESFSYMLEEHGLLDILAEKKDIVFQDLNKIAYSVEDNSCRLVEVRKIKNVNAIKPDQSLQFSPKLTVYYGANGSGKSGFARLLSNACSSKQVGRILPNLRESLDIQEKSYSAEFIFEDSRGNLTCIEYNPNDHIPLLKTFTVFDQGSIKVHLDQANNITYSPTYLQLFQKIVPALSELETKFFQPQLHDKRKRTNPLAGLFDGESTISEFCKGLSENTELEEFERFATFTEEDEKNLNDLEQELNEKRSLNIIGQRTSYVRDIADLEALLDKLQSCKSYFNDELYVKINSKIEQVLEKKELSEAISSANFKNPAFLTIGKAPWKSLIESAKLIYEEESELNNEKAQDTCILCQQSLDDSAKGLFKSYWDFLSSKAHAEFHESLAQLNSILNELSHFKMKWPNLDQNQVGVGVLKDCSEEYLMNIEQELEKMKSHLSITIERLKKYQKVDAEKPNIDLSKINEFIKDKRLKLSNLADPTTRISVISTQIRFLKHKKLLSRKAVEVKQYIGDLKWLKKASKITFPKAAITKKSTELFNMIATSEYQTRFNEECQRLNCKLGLTISTKGATGSTQKILGLDFAGGYDVTSILSEGEQRVCALADLLTEVNLDKNKNGIIFDDPVTSLDHSWKDVIAKRLVEESNTRQVIIFTHDIVFLGLLSKYTKLIKVEWDAHWIKKAGNFSGIVEFNTSPRLANTNSLLQDANEVVKEFETFDQKRQELSIGIAIDYLRSACEATIEEYLFAGTIKRYEDAIKVGNLADVVYDKELAIRIVELHGKLSEMGSMHNRSDNMRENLLTFDDFKQVRKELTELIANLNTASREAKNSRSKGKSKDTW